MFFFVNENVCLYSLELFARKLVGKNQAWHNPHRIWVVSNQFICLSMPQCVSTFPLRRTTGKKTRSFGSGKISVSTKCFPKRMSDPCRGHLEGSFWHVSPFCVETKPTLAQNRFLDGFASFTSLSPRLRWKMATLGLVGMELWKLEENLLSKDHCKLLSFRDCKRMACKPSMNTRQTCKDWDRGNRHKKRPCLSLEVDTQILLVALSLSFFPLFSSFFFFSLSLYVCLSPTPPASCSRISELLGPEKPEQIWTCSIEKGQNLKSELSKNTKETAATDVQTRFGLFRFFFPDFGFRVPNHYICSASG